MPYYYLVIDGAETGPFTATEAREIQESARIPYEVRLAEDVEDDLTVVERAALAAARAAR